MGLRMKDFNIFGFTEKSDFLGGVLEKPIYKGEWPKKGGMAWTVCKFKGGGLGKKEGDGWCF